MPRTLLRTVFNVNESFSFGVTKGKSPDAADAANRKEES
jgi:hypothetical protein